jgi:uncharacterized protein
MQEYATATGNQWGVGQKDKNNKLVMVVSKELSHAWIAKGLGTQRVMTDEICGMIMQTMIPQFRQGNFYWGIEKGLIELIRNWEKP